MDIGAPTSGLVPEAVRVLMDLASSNMYGANGTNNQPELYEMTVPRRNVCKVCDRQFRGLHQLRQHAGTHKDGLCKICGVMVTANEDFAKHMEQFHPDQLQSRIEQKPHVCETCKKRFADPMELQAHELTHPRRKPNACKQCKYVAATPTALRIHERVHKDEKPFECTRCDQAFRSNGALYTHLRSRHKVDPFKCEKCKTTFKMAKEMNAHKKECGTD